jgi:ComF family protein
MKNIVFKELLEFILPEKNTCLVCGRKEKYIKEDWICISCEAELKTIKGILCKKCSKPMDNDSEICNECIHVPKFFDRAVAPFSYEGKIKMLIRDFKYNNKSYLYKLFGNKMCVFLNEIEKNKFDAVIPVPIHKSKLSTRGYNQSELLASYIASNFGLPMVKLIIRNKITKPQNKLSNSERMDNVKGAFKISNIELKLKNILLVDDIYTTGATLNECSKLLKNKGAEKIVCLTIGR